MLLQRRSNQVLYSRWVCPPKVRHVVGKTELIKSLNTRHMPTALYRAGFYYKIVSNITRALQMQKLSQEQLESVIRAVWARLESVLKEPVTYDDVDANDGFEEWIDRIVNELQEMKGRFDVRTDQFEIRFQNWPELLPDYGVDPAAYLPEDRERIFQELLRVRYELYRGWLHKVQDFEKNPPTPLSKIIQRNLARGTMLFSQLYDNFIEYKIQANNLSGAMQGDYKRYYDDIIDLIGDLAVDEIKRATIKDFLLLQYQKLPRRNLKPYKNKKASELLGLDIPAEHRISQTSVSGMLKFIQGVFAYAVEKGIISASPATALKLGFKKQQVRGPFSRQQMQTMLSAVVDENKTWKKWVVLLAAYTGARLGEIVQLREEDVIHDEESGRHCIRITDEAGSIKTDNAKRLVPVHRQLIDSGLLSLVKAADVRLFPDLNPAAVSAWFPRFRDRCGIPAEDALGKQLVFHSFRHTVVTMVQAKSVGLSLIQEVVGHEKTDEGQTTRYTHQHSVADMCKVIDAISYYD